MRKQLVAVIVGLASAGQALGVGSGGFTNQVVGSKALGMGNAFVATADDPSAVFFNPAGLTQLGSPQVTVGFAPHFYGTEYKSDAGVTDKTENTNPVVPNLYGAFPFLNNRLVAAIGIQYPFGLSTKWSETGPLRYVATESLLNVMHVNPTLAYKVNDKLSLGAGVVISRMDVDLKAQINQSGLNTQLSGVATVSPDGTKELSGKGTGWGYNLGLLFRPFEEHSLGVSYRSQIMTRIKGKTEFTRLTGAAAAVFGGDKYAVNTETNLNLPESLILGYAYKPGKWTFEADAEWVDYSSIRQTKFDFMNESNAARLSVLNSGNPVVRDWHSSWNFGVGANYKFNKTWQARAGYYYYSEVIPENSWDPSTPDSSRNGITLGGSYMLGSSVMIDLAYNTLFFQKRVVHNSVGSSSGATVNGNYETMAHIISLNATYKFSIGSSRD